MVLQFGLAMILSAAESTEALISGTTSFFEGSMRHAEELSMTVIPFSANLGAHSKEVLPPAEKRATSGFILIASSAVTTLYFLPLKLRSLPADLSEATGMNSVTGNPLSSSTLIIIDPTRPVAPTTATFILIRFKF